MFNIGLCHLFLTNSISEIAQLIMDITVHEREGFREAIKMLEIIFVGILYKAILIDRGSNVDFLRSLMKILYCWGA